MSPTIREGNIKFRIYGIDHKLPHAHVFVGNTEVCEVLLESGLIINEKLSRQQRKQVVEAFLKHQKTLLALFKSIHDLDEGI